MFDWIADIVQAVTLAYLVRNYPGTLLLIAGAALAIVMAWKHRQKATEWRFNPRQMFDFGLGLVVLYLLAMGTYLILFWEP